MIRRATLSCRNKNSAGNFQCTAQTSGEGKWCWWKIQQFSPNLGIPCLPGTNLKEDRSHDASDTRELKLCARRCEIKVKNCDEMAVFYLARFCQCEIIRQFPILI